MIDSAKVEEIIRHVAATEIAPMFKNLATGDIREKNPGDFVTVADEASEKLFTQLLPDVLKDALIVGEESVAKDISVLDKLKSDKYVWVIDPIDGTYNFSHGRSMFGVLLALVKNGVTEYGWMYDIPQNRMAAGQRGAGAFLDGKRLPQKTPRPMKDMVVQGGGAQAWHFDPIRPLFKDVVNVRCSLYDFMAYISGAADAVLHIGKTTPWDHAAGILLSQEVGGYSAFAPDEKPYDPARYAPAFTVTAMKENWHAVAEETYARLRKK